MDILFVSHQSGEQFLRYGQHSEKSYPKFLKGICQIQCLHNDFSKI